MRGSNRRSGELFSYMDGASNGNTDVFKRTKGSNAMHRSTTDPEVSDPHMASWPTDSNGMVKRGKLRATKLDVLPTPGLRPEYDWPRRSCRTT